MGHNSKGTGKSGRNSAFLWRNLKDCGVVGASIWQREMVDDWGDAQDPDGVPSMGGATDHGDDGKLWVRRRVLLPGG